MFFLSNKNQKIYCTKKIKISIWLRHKLLHAPTKRLGETSEDESDPPEPAVRREDQRDLRNGQARAQGRGRGKGRGRGRKGAKTKEVEDLPKDDDDDDTPVEDLPEPSVDTSKADTGSPNLGPKRKRRAKKADPGTESKSAPKAKAKTRAKAKAQPKVKAQAKAKAQAKGKAAPKAKGKTTAKAKDSRAGMSDTGASETQPPSETKRTRKPRVSKATKSSKRKLEDFQVQPIPLDERPAYKAFL